MLHTNSFKQNAGTMADTIVSNASMAAQNLADEAQHTASRVGSQLADWTEDHGHQLVRLWNLGGGRARRMVMTKPLLSLTLVAGASAIATYLLLRRYTSTKQQTGNRSSEQNWQGENRLEEQNTESEYSAPQSTTVPPSTTVM